MRLKIKDARVVGVGHTAGGPIVFDITGRADGYWGVSLRVTTAPDTDVAPALRAFRLRVPLAGTVAAVVGHHAVTDIAAPEAGRPMWMLSGEGQWVTPDKRGTGLALPCATCGRAEEPRDDEEVHTSSCLRCGRALPVKGALRDPDDSA